MDIWKLHKKKKEAFAKGLEELQKEHGIILSTSFVLSPIPEEKKEEAK